MEIESLSSEMGKDEKKLILSGRGSLKDFMLLEGGNIVDLMFNKR